MKFYYLNTNYKHKNNKNMYKYFFHILKYYLYVKILITREI